MLEEAFALCQLPASSPTPMWAIGSLVSITRTQTEVSILCLAAHVPPGIKCSRGWRCLEVEGPLDHGMVGVLASIIEPLAKHDMTVLTLATYHTDFVFVRELDKAIRVLNDAGHAIGSHGSSLTRTT